MENNKILIVEDEEIIRLGLKDNFELENYIVETAGDGDEAIEKAAWFLDGGEDYVSVSSFFVP